MICNALELGCNNPQMTDIIVFLTIALGLFIVFGIPSMMESRKADKTADRIQKNRNKRKHQFDDPK
jgi:hypothetical protein